MTGERFQGLDRALFSLKQESIKTEAIPGPFILMAGIVLEISFILMIWLGLYVLANGTLLTAVLIAFLILGYRLYEPIKIVMVEYPVLSYMNVSLGRIIDVLEAGEQELGKDLKANAFDIRFEKVGFKYLEGKNILSNISFHTPEGSMTALVGPSGSGKTTIASLIARFWDVQKGCVSIGGIDLKDIPPQRVYSYISEVFQEVYLFNESLFENIKIGNPSASDEEIYEAARKAQVMEFVETLPDGLHTKAGEGGNKLSGGQKQRISIARALLKDAPIILLDEATASLDPENEIYIQRAIQELVRDKTVIVIAHKLASIRQADNIIVLDSGGIAESGRHDHLLQKDGLYAKLWRTQQKANGWKFKAK